MSYAGTILVVDLTTGEIERLPVTEELKKGYIGGQGLNAKLAYDLIKPGIDPLSPENVLIFGAGTLCGTMMPTAARTAVLAKSPVHQHMGISNAGGMAVMMKFAGYDNIAIKGRADKPVYLKIENDNVEILDAGHLWGKGLQDAVELLWGEIGDNYWVTCIGAAGENMVRFSVILNNKWHSFGHTGMGAVMGSKNLKAIAIYGTKSIEVFDKTRFMQVVDRTLKAIMEYPLTAIYRSGGTHEWSLRGTDDMPPFIQPNEHSLALHGKTLLDINAYFDNYKVMPAPCFVCPVGCRGWLESMKGENKGESFGISCTGGTMVGPYGFGMDIPEFDRVGMLALKGQQYGLSSHETSAVLAFALDLYEKGLITQKDTDGLELTWGNFDAIGELMRKIAMREGFGNILADGIPETRKRLSIDTEPKSGQYIQMSSRSTGGGTSVPRVRAENVISALSYDRARYPREYFDTIGKEGIHRFAENAGASKEDIDKILDCDDYDVALFARSVIPINMLIQSLGTCDRQNNHKVISLDAYREAFSAATGIGISTEELFQAGLRCWYLERAFSLREGVTKEDDIARVSRNREEAERLINTFYEAEGWDMETGKPTRQRLKELDLEYIADDLEV